MEKFSPSVQGKRKPIEETYAFMEWEAAKEALDELGEISDMDICIYYPEYFWLAKYHKKELGGTNKRLKK